MEESAMARRRRMMASLLTAFGIVAAGCAAPSAPAGAPGALERSSPPAAPKALTIGIWSSVPALGLLVNTSPVGGGYRIGEIHSDGLITADTGVRRPVGRLAEQVPTLENGGVSLLPDGRMRVAFAVRKGVTWHDGRPFTAQDLVFSYQFAGPDGVPNPLNDTHRMMSSVEATDDHSFVVYYKGPYYLGAALGTPEFWPLPRHILEALLERYLTTKNAEEILQHPYWTSEYIHLGPFRLARFDPGEGMSYEAYDRYFLGRPKIDTIRVRIFGDENTLITNLLAGTADIAPEFAVRADAGAQLKKVWTDGVVHVKGSQLLNLPAQMRPHVQTEPAFFDPRVRRAFVHALDREAISEGANGGNPQLAAWTLVSESDPMHGVIKDGLRQFNYDVDRARALLAEAGWTAAPGGGFRHSSDGRPLRTHMWAAEKGASAVAAYWRDFGVQVDELLFSPTQVGDREFRANFPGWDWTGADVMETTALPAASAENRWVGSRSGYDDPTARRLVAAFETSIAERDQAQAMRAFHDFYTAELPTLPLFHIAIYIGARKNVKAFEDIAGGGSWDPYGSHYRNSHLWDLLP
jgi:peptide/nickel transport system substrate-binding protein